MGVLDDIKDSLSGSSSDTSSTPSPGGDDISSDFDSGEFESSFQDNAPQGRGQGPQNQPQSRNTGNQAQGLDAGNDFNSGADPLDQPEQQAGNPPTEQNQTGQPGNQTGQPRNQNSPQPQRQQNDPLDSPNPQTGRPQEGQSEPQLSSQTERELENAGLRDENNQRRSQADIEQDVEQLKRQNEQIIDILKRINDALQANAGSNQTQRSGRHGGRR